jgi:hypothetical protein
MKKLLSLLALIAMLSLASCNKATEETTTPEGTDTTVETPVDGGEAPVDVETPTAE